MVLLDLVDGIPDGVVVDAAAGVVDQDGAVAQVLGVESSSTCIIYTVLLNELKDENQNSIDTGYKSAVQYLFSNCYLDADGQDTNLT